LVNLPIKEIHPLTLRFLENLTLFSIDYLPITETPIDLFNDLPNLQEIYINYTQFEEFKPKIMMTSKIKYNFIDLKNINLKWLVLFIYLII
jgi:hypothetical protein